MNSKYTEKISSQELKIQEFSKKILESMDTYTGPSFFQKDWWYGRVMEWSLQNEKLKTKLFHFIDVLPVLTSNEDIVTHMKEYFSNETGDLPSVFSWGMGIGSLAPGLLAKSIQKNVSQVAQMFITGESPEASLPALQKNWENSIAFTIDLLGELTLSEKEAQVYQNRYLELLDKLHEKIQHWETNPILEKDHLGNIPRLNISVKLSSLYSQINPANWEETCETLKTRLRPLFRKAMEKKAFINIDMEQYSHKEITLETFCQLVLEEEFRNYPHWGIVIQAYLRDASKDIEKLKELGKTRGLPISIRLVKGAYWDYETIHADQMRWKIPVFNHKIEADRNFELCSMQILENHKYLKLAIASHNARSISAALVMCEQMGLPKNAVEIQMLFGMAEPFKQYLIDQGYRVREYLTIGELIPGMAYLVRRLLENTANESFLRSKFMDKKSAEALIQSPHSQNNDSSDTTPQHEGFFENVPNLDWIKTSERENLKKALNQVKSQLGQHIPLVIHGQKIKTSKTLSSLNPSLPTQVVGTFSCASSEDADHAMESAKKAFPKWSQTPVLHRVDLLKKLADQIEIQRYELMAWQILEVGKSWTEADGDVCEAIDFCRYYAEQMTQLGRPIKVSALAGEKSFLQYTARGVSVVLAPWNFPLAILTGLVTANLVTGNTVLIKPAEQSTMIASKLMELLLKVGFPEDVVHFLPGLGEEVGAHLVKHPDIHTITFTGSREVGLEIIKKTADVTSSHVKKAVIEMGGKNVLIIDVSADLDEAVQGTIFSAFGFQGQKCSACSRVIILENIYDLFMERLKEAVDSLHVLPSEHPASFVGPVIDQTSQERILSLLQTSGAPFYKGQAPELGYFIPPTIFKDVDPKTPLAQEELFGPVLSVIKASNLEEALKIANDTDYGLTGGIYSRSPRNIEKVGQLMNVGNFYVNRPITGSIVGRHPFGGFKLSGIGNKAGGPNYLQQFMHEKVITENTLRRGFAPEED